MERVGYVVGGAGFLGSHLVDRLLSDGWRVGVIDPALRGEVPSFRGLVCAEALRVLGALIGVPTHVFHLGGSGSVGLAAADPDGDRLRTVESTRLLVEALPGARHVLVSSAAVYGEASSGPIAESTPLAPISVYGRHKADAEALVAAHAIVRLFSAYGPGLKKQLLWDACEKLARGEASFSGTGVELRDWLHVDDAVSLLVATATASGPILVNGGTGRGVTVSSVLEQLRGALTCDSTLRFSGEVRSGDPRSLVADIGRARALGWAPRVALADGLVEYARWFEALS